MKLVHAREDLVSVRHGLTDSLGFVPTMGALHPGHLALIDQARAENTAVIVSIFVNPLQFGPSEDLARYPRDLEADCTALAKSDIAYVYVPSVEMLYPSGFATRIDVGEIGETYEGASRPGHFTGVATVVAKLLLTVQPTRLYLGRKDAQQVAVVGQMLRDLDFPVELRVVETIREDDGLALSSRNRYLQPHERVHAASLFRALTAAANAFASKETPSRDWVCRDAMKLIEAPLVCEYLDIVDSTTFLPCEKPTAQAIVIGAARVGTTRLIDNVMVWPK